MPWRDVSRLWFESTPQKSTPRRTITLHDRSSARNSDFTGSDGVSKVNCWRDRYPIAQSVCGTVSTVSISYRVRTRSILVASLPSQAYNGCLRCVSEYVVKKSIVWSGTPHTEHAVKSKSKVESLPHESCQRADRSQDGTSPKRFPKVSFYSCTRGYRSWSIGHKRSAVSTLSSSIRRFTGSI